MNEKTNRSSLFLLLFVGFVDYMGLGLVFPLFAILLFHPDLAIVSPEVDKVTRGFLLGFMIAIGPIFQFFSSTVLGSYSDIKGRKRALLIGLSFGVISYFLSVLAIFGKSLPLMMISRAFFGVSAGTMAIVQAGIADVSNSENKSKNFGLLNMAYGAGFTFGPYIGGKFSTSSLFEWMGPWVPFAIAALLVIVNLSLIYFRFRDTHPPKPDAKISWSKGLSNLKEAFYLKEVRLLLLVIFLFLLSWDFFAEFIPVFLMERYDFSPGKIANFYAYFGFWYALSSGYLIRPLIKRFSSVHIFLPALFGSGLSLFAFLVVPNSTWLWFTTPIFMYFLALVFPTGSAEISNRVSEDIQGKVMGINVSTQALALVVSPLFSGSLVGIYPNSTVVVSGAISILAGFIFLAFSPRKQLA